MNAIFLDEHTSLEKIVEAGWYIEHSGGGGWWFRNRETQERQAVPFWIEEMVFNAQQAGLESMQSQIREVMVGKPRYLGRCNPFITAKKKAKAESPA